jgi:hypothetical protein
MSQHETTKHFKWIAVILRRWGQVILGLVIAALAVAFITTLVQLANDSSHVSAGDVAQVRLWEDLARQTVQLGTQPGSSPETDFQARLKALQDYEQACSLLDEDKYAGYTLVPRDISNFERAYCHGNP